MLRIKISEKEAWDPVKEEFIYTPACEFRLEHSLVAISKWESKYHKAFLKDEKKTEDELKYYIKCMILDYEEIDDLMIEVIASDQESIKAINDYIADPMTATVVNHVGGNQNKSRAETVTSELIYYWMTALQIPFECQYWHINRLLKLVEVCNAKNAPPKKMSRGDILRRNAALNAARRKK